jgi:hypothetical protein
VAWGKRLSPVTLILAGLVVSLYCGAINQLLVLFHHDQLQSMFLWSTGTLTQTDWSIVQRLWPQLAGGVVLTLLLLRPLTLMGLDDGVARNLGLALSLARLAALTLAIVLSALLVNAVGIIGFIGLFAPLLAKMLGARRLLARLLLAPLIGALILWLSDQIILWLARVWMEVSTGSATALSVRRCCCGCSRVCAASARLRWTRAIRSTRNVSRYCGLALPVWESCFSPRLPHSRLGAMPQAGTGQRVIYSTNYRNGAGRGSSPRLLPV